MAKDHSALLEPGWRDRWIDAGGTRLHLVEAGRAGDPLVVLLHGFPEFWWAWRHQITPLAEAGHHVVALDMRGYNLSEAPRALSAYPLDRLVGDVVAVADALGAERFRLVAHDWGAAIGWALAARHPQRVVRAVLMSAPHPDDLAAQVRRNPVQALRSIYIAFFQIPRLPEAILSAFGFARLKAALRRSARAGTFADQTAAHYVAAWRRGSLTGMINYYRAIRLHRPSPRPERLAPPVLVIWGDRDRFLGRRLMEASLARCDRGRFLVIEGGTHWLHLEEAARVSAEILRFLGEG